MKNSSAVCVLAGSQTFLRPFVRYEIARAVINNRGLLTVHVNDIPHIKTKATHPRGPNPLEYMGVGRDENGSFYLYECNPYFDGRGGISWTWEPYSDYRLPVGLPRGMTEPDAGYIMRLSTNADEYDYTSENGSKNIGSWIDRAARRSGR